MFNIFKSKRSVYTKVGDLIFAYQKKYNRLPSEVYLNEKCATQLYKSPFVKIKENDSIIFGVVIKEHNKDIILVR